MFITVVVGKDITIQKLRNDNEAVFIAAGAHKSRKLGIPGEQINGVLHGVEFLRDAGFGQKTEGEK